MEGKVQELSLHVTFAPVELSLLGSECPKNFRSMELLFPGTFAAILKKLGESESITAICPYFGSGSRPKGVH